MLCCRLVKRDDILQINLIYFSPHHKNKFINSVNSLRNSLVALAETKKANKLGTLAGLVCLMLANQNQNIDFLWSGNCSLFTDYTHLSLNMIDTYN